MSAEEPPKGVVPFRAGVTAGLHGEAHTRAELGDGQRSAGWWEGWLFTAQEATYRRSYVETQIALPSQGPAGSSEWER